jgi:hypothetical protein
MLTAALIGSVAIAGSALAGDYSSSHKANMMDTDKDGKVTAAEHSAGAKSMFTQMDTNGDGKVTATEMDAFHAAKKDSWGDEKGSKKTSAEKIKAIDTDGDGAISAEEHATGSNAMFSRLDTNQDGSLTETEIKAGHKRMVSDATPTDRTTPSSTAPTSTTETTTPESTTGTQDTTRTQ